MYIYKKESAVCFDSLRKLTLSIVYKFSNSENSLNSSFSHLTTLILDLTLGSLTLHLTIFLISASDLHLPVLCLPCITGLSLPVHASLLFQSVLWAAICCDRFSACARNAACVSLLISVRSSPSASPSSCRTAAMSNGGGVSPPVPDISPPGSEL